MFRRIALTVGLLGGCVWSLALVARGQDKAPAAGAVPFKPVASVESIMNGQGIHFDELKDLLDNANARGRSGKLITHAELLAELANVNYYNSEKEDYHGWAMELRGQSLDLAKEAQKGKTADETRMKELYTQIEATCKKCHDVYRNE